MDRSKCGPEAACCVALTFSRNPPFTQPLGRLFLPVSSTPTAKMWPFNPFRREARLLGSKNNKISKQIKPLPLLYVQRQKKITTGNLFLLQSRLEWKAHESLVLSVAWCSKCNLIASGGEDCIFKIWDSQGQLLHSSSTQLHPVTCISWSPDGKTCAFATFSTVCVTTSYGVNLNFLFKIPS